MIVGIIRFDITLTYSHFSKLSEKRIRDSSTESKGMKDRIGPIGRRECTVSDSYNNLPSSKPKKNGKTPKTNHSSKGKGVATVTPNRVNHRVILRKWLFFQIQSVFLRLPINS